MSTQSRLQSLLEGYDHVKATSQDVIDHFGADAPALLNRYCCYLEDALLKQQAHVRKLMQRVEALEEENHRLRSGLHASCGLN